jgi:biotin/methionine sulfoxide reductase
MSWLRKVYADCRKNARSAGIELPEFDAFWQGEGICLEGKVPARDFIFEKFRNDPDRNRLGTPSGKIEIYSGTIASFNYPDCPGHPVWMEKKEWLGGDQAAKFPLHMISNQPRNKLHSQLDFGRRSLRDKTAGRETVYMHPKDASLRELKDGRIVRIFNDRGACLAGIKITEGIMPGVISLPTGAWCDPDNSGGAERHGNPNVLTQDTGTSSLAQGPTAHSCLVEVEPFKGEPPPVLCFKPPVIQSK